MGRQARMAARRLAATPTRQKDDWLRRTAVALEQHRNELLKANARDLEQAQSHELTAAQVDRLRMTPERIAQAAAGLLEIAQLPDPVGQVLTSTRRPNGLEIYKVAVPLGVILFIYESRPNVTVDAAGLCVKSGNAIILRGGKESLHSNLALHRLLSNCLDAAGLPAEGVQLVDTPDRAAVGQLLRLNQWIDLVIPRGGQSLIRRVVQEATMPVLKHYQGNCHVYVDQAADLNMAERIIINAKCQRPGVCNAAESLLVHRAVAATFLPRIGTALAQRGVKLRGCAETRHWLSAIEAASEEDYAAEYLDLILSVKVVANLEEAMEHIGNYGSGHTDAIITNDLMAARQFTAKVDSAAVLVNASTRCHDGHEFGLGAEIGISTDKFHARGPCGLLELCSYKYVVYGDGQLRE
jgi:glutamate-5-semialdehyde dehydrogenase